MKDLPQSVIDLFQVASFAEFTTISAQGVPIDTPLLSFPDEDLSKFTMATGVAYPVKAERARRNPKVGLFYDAMRPGDPVVQVIGMAATRDRDIQANLLQYLSETVYVSPEVPWDVKQKAVWYWARILVEIYPVQILWWDGPDALDQPPHRWDAPADAVYPASDPAPMNPSTPAPKWPQPPWRDIAQPDVEAGYPAYVSLVDDAGFPRIMRARDVRLADRGLSFEIPAGAPGGRSGPASLTYFGRDTFVGVATQEGERVTLTVERALPILPLVSQPSNVFEPTPELKDQLLDRLRAELDRRGQPFPVVPKDQPTLTPGARRRAEWGDQGADAALFDGTS